MLRLGDYADWEPIEVPGLRFLKDGVHWVSRLLPVDEDPWHTLRYLHRGGDPGQPTTLTWTQS